MSALLLLLLLLMSLFAGSVHVRARLEAITSRCVCTLFESGVFISTTGQATQHRRNHQLMLVLR
jgi:hypothetical protein